MKKLLTLFLALAIGFGLKAQCPLTQAVDFTATDCHGTEIHLFDILDGGQYVLIDFFFANCGPCQQATPKVVESYYAMGCNMHDVFYMEISDRDSDAVCQNWCQNYGVEYPTISGPAGGSTICGTSMYHIPAFPTVILIAPDRSIVINDLWPINNAQTVITALEEYGLQQHDCNASASAQVTISIDQVLETEVTATFTPNEDCASYAYTIATESEIQEWMSLAGLDLPEYLWTYGIPGSDIISHTFNELVPDTEYTVYAVPADINGVLGEVAQVAVTTTPGGSTEIMPDFTTTDIDGNEIHLYDILDAGQAVLINFFLYDDEFSEAVMPDMIEAYRLYGCNEHDVFFMEISPNGHDDECQIWENHFGVQYPTISRDGDGNSIAQSIPVGYYPTIMLIRPDHTFANRDIYPPTLEYIINAMDAEGYMQYPCYEETLTLSADTLYFLNDMLYWEEGLLLQVANFTAEPEVTINSFDLIPVDGEHLDLYFIVYEGQMYWPEYNCNITIPQGETIDLYVYLTPLDGKSRPYLTEIVFHNTLEDVSVIASCEIEQSVNENSQSLMLYPNPANDFVTLGGESLGMVRVYNALGQKVDEFEVNGSELRINTTGYESGIYFVKTDEKTMKFVVKH